MKRSIGYLTLPLFLGLIGFYLTRANVPAARGIPPLPANVTETSDPAGGDASHGSQQPLQSEPPGTADERATVRSAGQTEAPAAAPLMLALYDELTEAIESLAPDCDGMAGALLVVLEERANDLKLALVLAQQSSELRAVDGSTREGTERQIREFNGVLKEQMPACSVQLMPVLKRLSAMEREQ